MIENLQSISARPVNAIAPGGKASGRADKDNTDNSLPGLGDYSSSFSAALREQGDKNSQAGDQVNLSPEAQEQLRQLKQRDAEVRAHEHSHMAAAGQYAIGSPHYEYQKGPDGRQYAIGGHVDIDVSAIEGDPEASQEKARQVRRAALAPGEPSGADRAVASQAASMEAEAKREEKADENAKASGVKFLEADPARLSENIYDEASDSDNSLTAHLAGLASATQRFARRAADFYASMSLFGTMQVAPAGSEISLQV